MFFENDFQRAALGHGLGAVLNHIQRRLFQQVGVYIGYQRFRGHAADQDYVAGGKLRHGQRQHVADHRTQILLVELQFHRAGEVNQHLHHPVQAVNLCIDNLQVTDGRGASVTELVLEQFQMHHDGVDGIFHFVADAGGESADGRHAAREFQFRLDLFG